MHINVRSWLRVVERRAHSGGGAHSLRLLIPSLLNTLRWLLLWVIVSAVDSTSNASRWTLVLTDLMMLAVVVSRIHLPTRWIGVLLLMACLRWTSTVTSHLDVATDAILVPRERLHSIHVTDRLSHLACWDDFRMLDAGAEASTSSIALNGRLLSRGIVVCECSCVGTNRCCALGA